MDKRQRSDGTWTFTSPEWDAKWYWPVGTRVVLSNGLSGAVVKLNSTTAHVRLDNGAVLQRVSFAAMLRAEGDK